MISQISATENLSTSLRGHSYILADIETSYRTFNTVGSQYSTFTFML